MNKHKHYISVSRIKLFKFRHLLDCKQKGKSTYENYTVRNAQGSICITTMVLNQWGWDLHEKSNVNDVMIGRTVVKSLLLSYSLRRGWLATSSLKYYEKMSSTK